MKKLFTTYLSRAQIRGRYGGLFTLLGFLSFWSLFNANLNAQVSRHQDKGVLLYVRFTNEQTLTASSAHTHATRLTYVMKYNLEDNAVALQVATRNPSFVQQVKDHLSGIHGFVSVEEKSLLEMNALTNHQWENVLPDTVFIQNQERELDTPQHELMHNHGHNFAPADNTNVSPGPQLIEKKNKNKFIHDLKPAANPFPCCANSQEGNIWYFGMGAGLSFNTNPPTVLTNNPMNSQDCSTAYSNPNNGTIMAFTNGSVAYGANLLPMPNGAGLTGHLNCTQGAIIIPKPGTNNQTLYLFTNSCDSWGSPFPAGQVRYSEINMALNGGNGDIVAGQKNILLNANSSERMTGIVHANGCDYWLLVKEQNNNIYRAYLITAAGVNPVPVTSATGTFQNQQTWNEGAMRISPNGSKVALAAFTGSAATGHIQLSDFNDATGVVSNTIQLNVSYHAYGVEFSPNSNVLYVNCCSYPMYQFNLQAANIQASQVNLGNCGWHSQLMLAPNCKIYNTDASGGPCLRVVNQPNVLGPGCQYVACGQSVAPKTVTAGAINVMSHIFRQHVAQITPGPVVNVCGTSQLFTGSPASVACQNYSYQWKLNGNNIPGATNITYTATQSGTYSLDVVHPNGCVSTATVTLTLTPPPTSSLTASPTNVCTGQNVTLTPGTPQPGWIHSWNCNGCSGNPSGGTAQTVNWTTPGVKTVNYTFTAGVCQPQTFTQVITVNPYPAGNITATGPVCASSSLTSTASTITFNPTAGTVLAGATYTWNCNGCNGGNPTGTNGPFTSSWLTSGVKNYTLTITNPAPSSCATTFTQTVSVTPLPSSVFTATPNPLCITASQSQPTSTVLNGPAGGAVYNWGCDGCVTPPGTTTQAPTVMWTTAGVKSVTLQITNSAAPGCTSPISTTLVTVNQAPDGNLALDNTQVCSNNAAPGSPMTVTATFTPTAGTLVSPTYSWNCDGCAGGNPTTAGPHTLSWAAGSGGVKTITLTVSNQAPTNCSKTFTSVVTVNEAPSSTFTLSANPLCANTSTVLPSTQLTFTGSNALAGAVYSWNCAGCVTTPGSNSGPHTVSWQNIPANHGVKTLSLIVTNPNGCVSPTSTVVATVNPTPTNVFTIPGPICETSSSTNFSANLSYSGQFAQSGATYNWGCDGCITPPTGTAGPFSLAWAAPGTKSITLQVVNPAPTSCAAPTQTIQLEVQAAPTSSFAANNACTAISATNNLSTVQYTGNAATGATFNWTCDGCNGAMTGAGPHNVSWTSPGNKTLTLQVQNPGSAGCTSDLTSVIITVSPSPTSTFDITSMACTAPSLTDNTATLTYMGNALVGATFSWDCDGCNSNPGNTAGPYTLSWNTPGNKTLTLTVTNPGLPACTSPVYSATTIIRQTPTSLFTAPAVCVSASRNNKLSAVSFNGFSHPGDNFIWNCDGCIGGNPQGQNPVLSWAQPGTKSMTLQVISPGQATCTSDITTVMVTVNLAPQDPIVNNMVRCGVGAVTMTASPGANGTIVRWYNSAGLPSQLLYSGSPYEINYLGTTTTYYVTTLNEVTGCESPNALPLVMNIAPIPGMPSVPPVSRCGPGQVTFSVTNGNPSGDAIHMFDSPFSAQAIGNPGIAVNPPYLLSDSAAATTTYYFSSFKTYATSPPITCESQRVASVATIHPIPAIPISTNEKRCGPGPITFLLDMGNPAGNEAYLFDSPTGGVALDYTNGNSNPPKYQLTTPLLPAAPPYFPYSYQDTFYVEARDYLTGCKSNGRGMYIGTVNVTPHPPTIPDLKRCGSGSLTFTATMIVPANAVAGNSIRIYAVETGGMPVATVQSPPYIFSSPVLTSTTTFYFESKIDSTNCPSQRIPAVATIFPYLNPPTTSDVQRCGPGIATLTVQTGFATGTHVRLYDLPVGGSVIAMDTIAPFEIKTPSVATTTIFYVESYFPQGPCWSSMRTPVKVVVNPAPDTAITPSVSRCGPGQVELLPKLSSPNGNVMRLYTQPSGGNMIAMDNLQTHPPFKLILDNVTTNSTYYVEVYNSVTGCVSPGRRAVTVTINPRPATPIVSDTSRCGMGEISLPFGFADSLATHINVYDALGGGNLLQNLTALPYHFVTTISSSSTFYASAFNPITGCESGRAPARAVVKPITSQPIASNITRCGGGTLTLSVAMGTVSGTGIEVYDSPAGGTLLAADNTPPYELTLGNVTLTTTFYVLAANDLTGCVSERKAVEAAILPVPSAPDALPISRCGAGGVTITAAMGANPGNVIRLYEQPMGGNPTSIAIAAPYLLRTPVVNVNTTYYIEAQNSATGCVSERNSVEVNILPLPGVPYAQDIFRCGPGVVTVTANMSAPVGDIIQLYSTNAGGAPLATVDVSPYELTTPIITTTTTLYLETKNSSTGCLSNRGSVKVTIIDRISAPVVFPVARCGSGVVTFSARMGAIAGNAIRYYDQPTGGALLHTTEFAPYAYTTPQLNTNTTFYIEAVDLNQNCSSQRIPVSAIINPLPGLPYATDVTRCGPGAVTFNAFATQPVPTEIRLYQTAVGGAIISIDKNAPFEFTTPNLTQYGNYVYYLEAYNEATRCSSERSPVNIIVNEKPGIPGVAPANICGAGTVTITVMNGAPSGQAMALYDTPVGGMPLATDNIPGPGGIFELATPPVSTSTTFFVESMNTSTQCGSERVPAPVRVNSLPDGPISEHIARCGAGVATFTAVINGGSNRIRMYTLPIGGSPIFEDYGQSYNGHPFEIQTPFIDTTHTYFFEAVNDMNQCRSQRIAYTVKINKYPAAPASQDLSACGSSAFTFTATLTDAVADGITLYDSPTGGTPLSSANSAPYYLSAPQIGVTTTFWLASHSSATGCVSLNRVPVVGMIKTIPNAPNVDNAYRCGPGAVTFNAVSAATLRLFNAPVGGNLLASGAHSVSTPIITTSGVYYISAFDPISGCESARQAVRAIIEREPALPYAENIARCGAGSVTLEVQMGNPQGNKIEVYADPGATTLLASASAAPYSINIPNLTQSTQLYIKALTTGGCQSSLAAVDVTIRPLPLTPLANTISRCGAGFGTFTASFAGGADNLSVILYEDAVSNTIIASSSSAPYLLPTPITTASRTYFIAAKDNILGCESSRVQVRFNINPIPATPSAAPIRLCGQQSAEIPVVMGEPAGNEVRLYDALVGGTVIASASQAPFTLFTPTVSTSLTYYIASLDNATGCESQRAAVPINLMPLPSKPIAYDVNRCGAGSVIITAEMGPAPGTQIRLFTQLNGATPLFVDATAPYHLATPELLATTTFYVESYANNSGCASQRAPVIVTVQPLPEKPLIADVSLCGSGAGIFTANLSGGDVAELYATISGNSIISSDNSAPYTLTTPVVGITTQYYIAALNSATGCRSERTMATLEIRPVPAAPQASNASRCDIGAVTVTATMSTPPGSEIRMYDAPIGNNLINKATQSPYLLTTPILQTSATYYLESLNLSSGCKSERIPVVALIQPTPDQPILSSLSSCGGGDFTFTAQMGNITGTEVRLYNQPIGGSIIAEDNAFPYTLKVSGVNASATYYATVINAQTGCESNRTAVNITIHGLPGTPQAADIQRCGFGAVTITALMGNPSGNEIALYDAPVAGAPIHIATNSPFILTVPSVTTSTAFYLESRNTLTGCNSDRKEVRVSIEPQPGTPNVLAASRCGGGTVTFEASLGSPSGDAIYLYDQAVGGALITSDNSAPFSLTVNNVNATTVFYAVAVNSLSNCQGVRTPVTATINELPGMPIASGISICEPKAVIITALMGQPQGGIIRLYDSQLGGSPLVTDSQAPYELLTPYVSTTTVFYLESYLPGTGCSSARTPVTVNRQPQPVAPIAENQQRCGIGTVTFSVTSSGEGKVSVYSDLVGGEAIATASAAPWQLQIRDILTTATYYLEQHNTNTGCVSSRTPFTVTILPVLQAPQVASLYRCGTGSGVFSVQVSDLNVAAVRMYNAPMGGTLLASDASAPYTLQTPLTVAQTSFYFDVLSRNGCASDRVEATLFINPVPGAPTAEPKVLCGPGRTVINAQMGNPGAAMLRLFSSLTGGMPLATDATYPYELATPELNATTTFYVSSFDPGTGCESNRTPVTVGVNAIPPAPLVQDVVRCGVGAAILSATIADPQVNEVRLYSDLTSSNMLATAMAPYHITTPFIEATTTFYVSSVNATTRCESERVPVVTTVKPAPGRPSALGTTRCGAGVATITAQMGAPAGSQMRLYAQANATTPVASVNAAPWVLSPGSVNNSAVYYLESYNPLTGCASERVPVNVQVVEIPRTPTVASNGPICLNEQLNLSASGSGEVAYLWRGPAGFEATEANPALTVNAYNQAGLYSVVAINGSCSSETATTLVNVKPTPPRPIAGFYNETELVKQICEGNELALEVKNYSAFPSGTRFTWVGPNTFLTTSHPSPSIPNIATINEGDYYILAFADGCTSLPSNQVTVLVRVNPQPPVASNNGPVCAGSGNIQLFASNVPGATQYIWSGPNGFVQFGQNVTAPALPNNSGQYGVRVIVDGCTSEVATQMVEVTPMPNRPLASATTVICAGQTLQLTAQGANPGAMYVWKGPNGFSAATLSGLAQVDNALPTASGVYTVTVVGAQCTSSAATVQVNVKEAPQQPTLTYSGPTCEGGELKFTVSGIPGGVFMWHGPNGYVHTSDELVLNRRNVSLTDAGLYSVSVMAEGCNSRPATIEATVNRNPVLTSVQNNGPLCEGANLQLTATATDGATIHWRGPGGFTANTSSVTRNSVFASQGGVYEVYATLGNCTSGVLNSQVTINRRPEAPNITNNGPVCAGGNVEFNVSGVEGATYYLYGPAGYQAAGVGGVYTRPAVLSSHAGVYSVVAVVGSCTSSFSVTTLELKPEVSVPIAGNNSPLCPGQNLKLEAAGNASGSYYWMGPDGFTQITSASSLSRPAITQQASGIYTVVAIANGCTSGSATTLVEIIPAPHIQTVGNNGPRCVGEELKLTAIGPVEAQYYWSGPANFSALGANASRMLTGVHEAGVYKVYAVVGGCTTQTLSTLVDVRRGITLGEISAPQLVCSGSTLTLSVPSATGVTYQWSGPNNFSAIGSTVTRTNVSLFDSGNYTVTASNGVCSSLSAVTTVEIVATPSGLLAQSNGPVCVGQALQLNATSLPDVTYEWSGPNGFTSDERNPVIMSATIADAGYYSVVARNGGCQSEPAQVEVSIVPQPRTPAASSNAPICTGKTLTLNASNVAGATYQWSGPMGWNANEQNPIITNVTTEMSGQYTVMAVIGNCYSAPASVSVQVRQTPATPMASAVTPSLCAGQTLQLQASTIPGATYTWSGPNNFSSASQNPVRSSIGILDGGSYAVYATQNGCRSEVATVSVMVNQAPNAGVISHNGPVCVGADLQLSAAQQQGASYIWNGPAGFSASVVNPAIPEVTASNAGVYSLVVVQNGCTSRVVTATIQVNNCAPTCIAPSSVSAVAQGSDKALVSWQLPLSGTPVCYIISYGIAGTDPASWTTSIVPHPNRTLVVENLQPNTVYSFRLRTNCTSCSPGSGVQSNWSTLVTATTAPAKVTQSVMGSDMKLYPNPNHGSFELVYQSVFSGEAQVVVYDITGRDVYRQAWNVVEGENTLSLQLNLPSGIYIVELLQGEYKASLKMQAR